MNAPSRRTTILGLGAAVASGPVLGISGLLAGSANAQTMIDKEITTVLFDAAASPMTDGLAWAVPLHAWTYRAQNSKIRKAAIAALFEQRYGLTVDAATQPLFDRRINLLLADNVEGQRPTLTVGGQSLRLPTTRANGHTRGDLRMVGQAGLTPLEITSPGTAPARLRFVPANGLSIISDIDDTVKDTGVLDRRQLWHSTFFAPFQAVPGMAALIARLGGTAPVVHFVSSSPWHLTAPLNEWLAASDFPVTSLHLKHIRLKDSSVLNLFGSPLRYKSDIITGLLARWPRRQFILMGDSGEADPDVYAAVAQRAPTQIARILIRRAPGDLSPPDRFTRAFAGVPATRWQVFSQPDEVA